MGSYTSTLACSNCLKGEIPDNMSKKTRQDELTLILMGKSGSGKSATGNSILGKNTFLSKLSAQSVTKAIQQSTRTWKNWKLVVVDTPSILKETDLVKKWKEEHCIVIMVIQLGRYTEEDREVYRYVKKTFNKSHKKMVFLFTRKEDLEGEELSDYVNNTDNEHLKKVIKKHNIPYCAFNNKTTDEKEKQSQLGDLMSKIMPLVKAQ